MLIKIWNWNSNWELSVVDERGKTLEYTPVWAYDPLHIAALSVPRFNNSGITSTPSFVTESATNFFKVKADAPTRPDDHRQGRIRAHVDRGDAAPESLLDGCLQTQMIHN